MTDIGKTADGRLRFVPRTPPLNDEQRLEARSEKHYQMAMGTWKRPIRRTRTGGVKTQEAVDHARACKEDLLKQQPIRWTVKKLNGAAAKIAAENLQKLDSHYRTVKNLEGRIFKELNQNRI
jgi:hypothetical protein